MSEAVEYSVRDPYGNIYGPASAELLRQWVGEGRIIAGMAIGNTVNGATVWTEASSHPVLAELFQRGTGASGGGGMVVVHSQQGPEGRARVVTPVPLEYGYVPRKPRLPMVSMGLGIAAFIFSVPSPLVCCCGVFSVPMAIAGVITGTIALLEGRASTTEEGRKTPAWIGVALSVIALLITVVGIGVAVALQWHTIKAAGMGL